MDSAKQKIKQCVEDYIKNFPTEYDLFRIQMQQRKEKSNDRFASVKGSDMELRAVHELPQTLYQMIVNQLDADELSWWKEGGSDRKEGARWLVRNYPVFQVPDTL